jgi:NAD-dependent dihydropyrimidine dehydrogenase PreA subunit
MSTLGLRGGLALIPAIISALLLGAHFGRAGEIGLLLICIVSPVCFFIRRRWTLRVMQAALLVGGAIWIDTAIRLGGNRISLGMPWIRLAIIIGGVGLFSALAAVALQSMRVFAAFIPTSGTRTFPGFSAFVLTFGLLGFIQTRQGTPFLLLERYFHTFGWVEVAALAFYAAWVVEEMLLAKRTGLVRRRIWTVFSIIFFLQLFIGLAGVERFLMSGSLHIPVPALIAAGPLYRGDGLFMIALFFVTVLFIGPAWCSHLCYIGAWDSAMAQKLRRPAILPGWRRHLQVVIALAVVLLAIVMRWLGVSASLAAGCAIAFGLLGVGVMAFWSRKTGVMTHCVSFCPIGVFATWFGKLSPFRMRINSACTDCGACKFACRYDALSSENISNRKPGISCTLCGDCTGHCGDRAIEYRFLGLKAQSAKTLFVVLVVSLHAVFLGVARM